MKTKQTTFIAITVSLMIHLSSGSGLYLFSKLNTTPNSKPIEVTLLTESNEKKPTDQVKKNDDQLKLKQIVEQDKLNDEIDEKAKFLSSHNQRVLQETVAKNHGQFKNLHSQSKQNTQNKSKSQVANLTATTTSKSNSAATDKDQEKSHSRSPSLQDLLLNSDLYANQQKVKSNKLQMNKDSQQKGSSENNQNNQMNQQLSENSDSSQTQDYLKDQKEGNETLLSTREFVYFSYYQRIREQLNQHWESQIKQKIMNIFRSGRRIASKEDIVTKVLITLNSQGTLIKVQVVNESGIRDLDDAAIEAFRAAAPFPNPPRGIEDADGNIKIRWDFVIEA